MEYFLLDVEFGGYGVLMGVFMMSLCSLLLFLIVVYVGFGLGIFINNFGFLGDWVNIGEVIVVE